jgi:hypothetical protein
MAEDQLDPELEKLFKQLRLKEPPPRTISDYFSGVQDKITRIQRAPIVGILLIGVVLAAGFAAVELAPFLDFRKKKPPIEPVIEMSMSEQTAIESVTDFELEVLGAVDTELDDEMLFDLLEGEELTNEFLFMDQIEVTSLT